VNSECEWVSIKPGATAIFFASMLPSALTFAFLSIKSILSDDIPIFALNGSEPVPSKTRPFFINISILFMTNLRQSYSITWEAHQIDDTALCSLPSREGNKEESLVKRR
jgi:hypothetical protein